MEKKILRNFMRRLGRLPIEILYAGYPLGAQVFQCLLMCTGSNPVRENVLWFIKFTQKLFAWKRSDKPPPSQEKEQSTYQVYVINRDCDIVRLQRFQKRAMKYNIPFKRISAIDFADSGCDYRQYESQIGNQYYGRTLFLKGAIGCFLSHSLAWKKIQESGKIGFICEDDARLLGPIPASVEGFLLPKNADLIFANARMASGLLTDAYFSKFEKENFSTVPLWEALLETLSKTPHITGPGGEGYFLTSVGAEKLLRMIERKKITMEVDWFLLFHSLSDYEMNEFIAKDGSGRFDSVVLDNERLHSFVLLPSLVDQASMGSSIQFDRPESYIERSELFKKSEQ